MTDDIVVRDMEPADVKTVVAIEQESYTVPWSEATFRGLLRRRDAEMIVAVGGDRVVGYAAFWCVVDQGELGNVATTAGWRRRGIGARLIIEILRRADQRGVREIFLEVRPTNAAARRLYDAFGFVQVGRRRNYYQEPVEDALVLRRPVRLPTTETLES
jgi:[ribosomal protein S18]-alanine N-acetyltransferase